jgi:aromatic-L-amino-acid decarboxylase
VNNEDFRRHAHTFVDWMADYLENVERYPVRAQVRPGEIAAKLPAAPPEEGESMERIFAEFHCDVLPGMTHWQHPNFFAYFPANSSPPSVLAEMLTATLAAQCMLWQTSPAATEMETRMMDWLRRMTGLPEGFHGVIQDSASSATLCALLAARERATGWAANEQGLGVLGGSGRQLAVYASAEAHSSVEKNVMVAGLGRESLRKIPVGEDYAMRPEGLAEALAADLDSGITPVCVIATLGTTGTGGFDPLAPLGEICQAHGIWLHVDAAWAGSALILPEQRWMIEGIETADSFVFNPHKWLFTNFDCSAFFLRNPDVLTRTLSVSPAYLRSREGGQVIDYRDWSVPLGRRFRALKLWFVIRAYGVKDLRRRLADHIAWAQELAGQVAAETDFELLAPARLALFNFRHHPAGLNDEAELDELNEHLLETLNDSGRLYLTQNRIGGRFAIRFSVGQTNTTRDHVQRAWQTIKQTAARL